MNALIETETTANAIAAAKPRGLVTVDPFDNPQSFEHSQRVAKVFASSSMIPKHLQGNVSDCLILYHLARRLNEDPLALMQATFVVNGRPGFSTAYLIARARRSGTFNGPITWREEGAGDTLALTAVAILADTGEEVAVTTDMRMAKAEGWTKNTKYQSMPAQMLRWRSAAMLIRLYAPEVMLGLPVVEEYDPPPQMRDVTPARPSVPPASIANALDAFADEAKPDPFAPITDEERKAAAEMMADVPPARPIAIDPDAYVRYCEAVLDEEDISADALAEWWNSAEQKASRAELPKARRDALRDKVTARLDAMRAAAETQDEAAAP